MLEIKNLCRTYTTKGGVVVKALDNVSLDFESTGMVFVLGKSGSGKSTLLNVVGGLDKYDSGEIIIKGRSSATFTSADFDSYRNTFIGFIFQDYNILEDFTVAKNIALAMELQGKKADKTSVERIIESVDLSGYGDRKPNTLSGGQKQRVAIARALIKEPEIIMADEPTGALDSNTGRQVFDTLKNLSKTKLVIVVSHDREFAEFYGDRVIELADGKIISDVKKYFAPPQNVSGGITVTDNSIIMVKKGQPVTPASVKLITDFISQGERDIIISADEKSNRDFRKAARMDENGNKESFEATTRENTSLKQYDGKQMKLIKSHLPYKDSLKMGASSLKHKPVRLFFTILLSAIAFGLFGLTDTLGAYDKVKTATTTIMENGISNAAVQKVQWVDNGHGYKYSSEAKLSDADIAKLSTDMGLSFRSVGGLYRDNNSSVSWQDYLGSTSSDTGFNQQYHIIEIPGVIEVSQADLNEIGFSLEGALPDTYGQIAITKFQLDILKLTGLRVRDSQTGNTSVKKVSTAQDVIGQKLFDSSEGSFTVTGVVDTKFETDKYAHILAMNQTTSMNDYLKMRLYQDDMKYGYHCLLFVKPGYRTNLTSGSSSLFQQFSSDTQVFYGEFDEYPNGANLQIRYSAPFNDETRGKIVWQGAEQSALSDSEIVVTLNAFDYREVMDEFGNLTTVEQLTNHYSQAQAQAYADANYEQDSQKPGFPIDLLYDAYTYTEALSGGYAGIDLFQTNPYGTSGIELWTDAKVKVIEQNFLGKKITVAVYDASSHKGYAFRSFTVAGVYRGIPDRDGEYYEGGLIANDSVLNFLNPNSDGVYSFCIASMPHEKDKVRQLVEMGYDDSGSFGYVMKNSVISSLENVNDMIETMAKAFLYVGIGFAVFAALMLMNFISTSIAYKKREIGILRAVGARGSDVFGIFFNESIIIAIFNYILAVVLAIVGCVLLNGLIADMGLQLKILVFGIRQLALMFAVCIGVAFVSSFIPTKRISSKRPIDAIQNR